MQLGQLGNYFGKNCHILVLKLCRLDEWVIDTGSEFQIWICYKKNFLVGHSLGENWQSLTWISSVYMTKAQPNMVAKN